HKNVRKAFVPVPDHAAMAVQELNPADEFATSIAAWVTRKGGVSTTREDIINLPLPDYLRINVRVMSMEGKVIAEGRDLLALKRRARVAVPSGKVAANAASATHRTWDFGELPLEHSVERQGVRFIVHPTIE